MAGRYQIGLDDDVRDVLQRSAITATTLTLPAQLDRKLYERVNKVLVAAGGKWARGKGAHVFKADPRAVLGLAIENGAITDQKKAQQQFFTPSWLAEGLAIAADIQPGVCVLEPSAGAGALALAARARGGQVTCGEIDLSLVLDLKRLGFETLSGDFLQRPAEPIYDRVLMNPPFTKGQDVTHVTHALKFLKPGGRMVSVMSGGIENKTTKAAVAFFATLGTCPRVSWVGLPDEAFKESGTAVRTVRLVVDVP